MMLALRLALAALVLHLVLVLPSHPGALTPGALLLLPLELPLLLALLVAGRGARWLRGLIVAVLMLSVALRRIWPWSRPLPGPSTRWATCRWPPPR